MTQCILHLKGHESARKRLTHQRSRRRSVAWLAAALVAIIGFAWYLARPVDDDQRAGAPDAPKAAVPVGVAASVKGDLDVTIAALGTVTPLATVSVKARVSGHLVRLGFEEGRMVKAGDFLAEIDPRPDQHALAQAQGQLLRDQALLDNARLDLDRYRRLVQQNTASRKQLDTQESLVKQYEGAVMINQAQVDRAKLNLDYCRITAPVSGRIGLRQVDLGNYLQAGDANGIVVITQLQPIAVVFPVAEDHLAEVMASVLAGEKLPVMVYDRGGRKLLAKGILATIDNQIDPATGTVKFKARFDNKDLALFPNQFVKVRLLVETLREATLVPSAAIQYGPKGPFVYAVSDDGVVAMRPVALGPAEGETVVVRSGLEPGLRVVVAGADRLRDGAKAKVAGEEKADGRSQDRGAR